MRWRCVSCDGEYDDTLPDGGAYYHACPPERLPTGAMRERPDRRDENLPSGLRGQVDAQGHRHLADRAGQPVQLPEDGELVQAAGAGRVRIDAEPEN